MSDHFSDDSPPAAPLVAVRPRSGPRAAAAWAQREQQDFPHATDRRRKRRAEAAESPDESTAIGEYAPADDGSPDTRSETQRFYVDAVVKLLHQRAIYPGRSESSEDEARDAWASEFADVAYMPVWDVTGASKFLLPLNFDERDARQYTAILDPAVKFFKQEVSSKDIVVVTADVHQIIQAKLHRAKETAAPGSPISSLERPTVIDTIGYLFRTAQKEFCAGLKLCIANSLVCSAHKKQKTK